MKYPECDKLLAVQKESQAIGEFIEWARGEGMEFARPHQHDDGCHNGDGFLTCDYHRDQLVPVYGPIDDLLARHFGIDMNLVEKERRQMLNDLRKEPK